jgi:hypothetical protein
MRSILTRLAFAGIAGALAMSAALPASAATHHKRAPVQNQFIDQPVAARPEQPEMQNILRPQNDCVSDEGYGRYSSCDGGGGAS